MPPVASDCRNDKRQNFIILMSLACSEPIKFFYTSQPNNTNVETANKTAVRDTANLLILWKQKFVKFMSTGFVLMNAISDLLVRR